MIDMPTKLHVAQGNKIYWAEFYDSTNKFCVGHHAMTQTKHSSPSSAALLANQQNLKNCLVCLAKTCTNPKMPFVVLPSTGPVRPLPVVTRQPGDASAQLPAQRRHQVSAIGPLARRTLPAKTLHSTPRATFHRARGCGEAAGLFGVCLAEAAAAAAARAHMLLAASIQPPRAVSHVYRQVRPARGALCASG